MIRTRSIICSPLVSSWISTPTRSFSVSLNSCNRILPSYKVAIVGTGPAGFYTAHHLLNKASPLKQFKLNIDFFERLPAPYGLSRYGVAPDHPEVKNCEEYLDNIMKEYHNSSEEILNHVVRFIGNTHIGKDISLEELNSNYDSVILSYGCTTADNELEVPGAQLPGVISARQFVNWYNGHPDFYAKDSKFIPPALDKVEDVTIIGNGNVALDVARILLAEPGKHWSSTDISNEALEALHKSNVKNVNIVARRGLLESAFSNKEIRELLELSKDQKVRFIPIDTSVMDGIQPLIKDLGRIEKRRLALLEKYSKQSAESTESSQSDESMKTWSLQYLKSPKEFKVNASNPELLSSTVFNKNELIHELLIKKTKFRPKKGETEVIKNELVIMSIGYKGSPLIGFEDMGISFDTHNNRLLNREGRILSTSSSGEKLHDLVYKKGWYTSGWIKNGPKGVIATTMMESFETADNVLEDLSNDIRTSKTTDSTLDEKLKDKHIVHWDGWLTLNEEELRNGATEGKSRDKICDINKMIEVACK